MTTLAKAEKSLLTKCEEVIERGLDSFIEVGNALLQIREERLYKAGYDDFETYCQERWDMSGRRARQLTDAAQAMQNIGSGTMVPKSERVVRPLTSLAPSIQREAWEAATETARTPGKPTAKEVEAAVEVVTAPARAERINYKPSNGLQYAAMAIANLEKIQPNDTERVGAFAKVSAWLSRNK